MAYLKLKIINSQTGLLVKQMYFEFTKLYQTSFDGKTYVKDPVLEDKIVKNGILEELRPVKAKDGSISYKKAKTKFEMSKMRNVESNPYIEKVKVPAITQTSVRYSEKPKMIFLVTPPHLMKYAKLILILIKQLVDLNFDQSYMTKSSQKPLYKTRFMLDELGNLQSEGHGIDGFETMLSIGLGQEQQFTLILQTLQQLRDVYGESVDKIVQGNTSNIVFLKSTDDSMIETLSKMSGTTHKTFIDSKTITRDISKIAMKNEGKASYNMSTQEVPVVSYNDMAFIPERNSIIFRAGDSPIWNRNETILPMSWRLFANDIKHAGHDYTLQTLPTLSSAKDFDVRKNQPDFQKMLDKRIEQAMAAKQAMEIYQKVHGYSDYEITQLDPDDYADDIMEIITVILKEKENMSDTDLYEEKHDSENSEVDLSELEDNKEQERATKEAAMRQMDSEAKRYADGQLSKSNLVSIDGKINRSLELEIIKAYLEVKSDFWTDKKFMYNEKDESLSSATGVKFIIKKDINLDLKTLNDASKDANLQTYNDNEEDIDNKDLHGFGNYELTDDFYKYLVSLNSWTDIASGKFERVLSEIIANS